MKRGERNRELRERGKEREGREMKVVLTKDKCLTEGASESQARD